MAWISVHEQLKDHRKVRELARLLGCNRHEALGILVTLWLWGINNADRDGNLGKVSADDIADGVMYRALCAAQFTNCLIESGWIEQKRDGEYALHDWDIWQQYWYKALDKREANTKRMRAVRAAERTLVDDCAPHSVKHSVVDVQPHVQASTSPKPSPKPSPIPIPIPIPTNDSPTGESRTPIRPSFVKTDTVPAEYALLIDAHTENPELRRAICDWFLMRKAMGKAKAVNTIKTLELTLKKAKREYGSEAIQIEAFNYATEHSHQGLYYKPEQAGARNGYNKTGTLPPGYADTSTKNYMSGLEVDA